MKWRQAVLAVGMVLTISSVPLTALAQTPEAIVPPLVIREIKVTGDEMIVLQATQDIDDLSSFWLGYAASDLAAPGSVVPAQQLPAYAISAGQAVLMSSTGGETCDAVILAKLSVSLGDSKGTVVVRQMQTDGLVSTFTTIDSVNWAKPSASATTSAALDLRKETPDLLFPIWYHDPAQTQPWRLGSLTACTLSLVPLSSTEVPASVEWAVAAIEPLAIIESLPDDGEALSVEDTVSANLGLAPPLITELLPNPTGTGNDSTDEFIELYNSNDQTFTLAGFTLQTGLTTTHSWVFPAGTTIAPHAFKAFYANDTGLSMSNTSGQATLLDTAGKIVAQTDPYGSAKDGQSWALANGTWFWTVKPTPGATNVIAAPIVSSKNGLKAVTTTASKTTSTPAVKAASTKKTTAAPTSTSSSSFAQDVMNNPAIHVGVLALVAATTVGYLMYEYRHDLANAFYKFRKNGIFRRGPRG